MRYSTTCSSFELAGENDERDLQAGLAQNLQRPQAAESGERIDGQDDIRPGIETCGEIGFGGHSLAMRVKAETRKFVGD